MDGTAGCTEIDTICKLCQPMVVRVIFTYFTCISFDDCLGAETTESFLTSDLLNFVRRLFIFYTSRFHNMVALVISIAVAGTRSVQIVKDTKIERTYVGSSSLASTAFAFVVVAVAVAFGVTLAFGFGFGFGFRCFFAGGSSCSSSCDAPVPSSSA